MKIYRSKMAGGRRPNRTMRVVWKLGNPGRAPERGKGMGLKTDDCATAALCVCCHDSIDNGNKLSRDERRQLMDRAIVLTLIQIARRGLVVPL